MKNNDLKIVTILIVVAFVLAGILLLVVSCNRKVTKEPEQETPQYWYSDISRYSIEYYSKRCAQASCNYPSTFKMNGSVHIEFLEEPQIRTKGNFSCQNGLGITEQHSFIMLFYYNAEKETFTLKDCTII